MATRTVTGRLLRPSGAPWAGGEVHFVPQDDAFTISPQQTVPVDAVTGVAASDGYFSVVLVSGLAVKYTVTLPDRQTFPLTVNDGGAVSLEQLRADTSIAPVPPQTVEDIIDAIVAGTYVEAAGDQMSGTLEVAPPTGAAQVQLTASGSNHSEVLLRRAGATKWRVRVRGSDDVLAFVNEVLGSSGLEIDDATNAVTMPGALTAGGAVTLGALAGSGSRPVVASASGALSAGVAADTSGLVFIRAQTFTGVTAVSLDTIFSSTFLNYEVDLLIEGQSAASQVQLRLRVGGADHSGTNHWTSMDTVNSSGVAAPFGAASAAAVVLENNGTAARLDSTWTIQIARPALANATNFLWVHAVNFPGVSFNGAYAAGHQNQLVAYDGLSVLAASGTMTGRIVVYGKRAS